MRVIVRHRRCSALGAGTELNDVYRRLLNMALKEWRLIEEQMGQLDQEMASLHCQHQDAFERLTEEPVWRQTAKAAVKTKGSIFEIVYRRTVPVWGISKPSELLPSDSVASSG